ncbi:MAG: galactokinase [Candidatus Thorarchaeota archaeon]
MIQVPKGMLEELQRRVGTDDVTPYLSKAPGRIEVLGNHTDYNAGLVLSATINKYVWSLGVPSDTVNLVAMDLGEDVQFQTTGNQPDIERTWKEYAKGVYWAFERRKHRVTGVTAVIHGDVPRGGGLSSSAAFEVSLASLVLKISGLDLNPKAAAMISFEAERLFCGVSCGIMDQFTSQLGEPDSLLSINCRNFETRNVTIPAGVTFVVIDSMISRSADNALGVRRTECLQALKELQETDWAIQNLSDLAPAHLAKVRDVLDNTLADRVTHVVQENDRVRKGIEAIKGNDLDAFGKIMIESHSSSRDLYKVSHPNLDFLVEASIAQEGVMGARLSGAGFGGAVLALVKEKKVFTFMDAITKTYESEMGRIPDIIPVTIPGGVTVEKI